MTTDTADRPRALLVRIARCDMRMRRDRRIADAFRSRFEGRTAASHGNVAARSEAVPTPGLAWFENLSGTLH